MVKVSFPFSVKYGGKFHSPSEALEVAENEVDKLVALGAKALGASQKSSEKAQETSPPKSADKTPSKKEK